MARSAGYLLFEHEGDYALEAEATLEGDRVVTRLLPSTPVASASRLLPISVVAYVGRTKQHVLLDDAAAEPGKFAADPYLEQRRARSVLCLPILRQAKVVGLLYLENALVAGAFTPERLVALELLASQAAISVENALLLSKERAARTLAEEAERRAVFLAEAERDPRRVARLRGDARPASAGCACARSPTGASSIWCARTARSSA